MAKIQQARIFIWTKFMKVFPIKDEMISSLTLSLRKVYSNRKIPTYWLNFISSIQNQIL